MPDSNHDRGRAALLTAQLLLDADLPDEQRSLALGKILRLNEDLFERRWSYISEWDVDEPQRSLFFSFHVDSTDGYNSHSIHWNCYPAEGTVCIRRSIDEAGYVDLDPEAWFTVNDTEGLAAVLDAVPQLAYKDELPEVCWQHGAIVQWGDELYETTLTIDQVRTRRRRPAPTPADQVLDALRDVYDTCPKCHTYTGGQPHSCP
ncbi:hypothetical protein [Agrococcus citreus]|uniref:Uncharacterized protein n=1 Tax=Agrococcus citreus TaxID=84643 RepID=A0ABN1YNZ2_9MICO